MMATKGAAGGCKQNMLQSANTPGFELFELKISLLQAPAAARGLALVSRTVNFLKRTPTSKNQPPPPPRRPALLNFATGFLFSCPQTRRAPFLPAACFSSAAAVAFAPAALPRRCIIFDSTAHTAQVFSPNRPIAVRTTFLYMPPRAPPHRS